MDKYQAGLELLQMPLFPEEEVDVAEVLGAAPWCWPLPDSEGLHSKAMKLCRTGIRELTPGEIPLLTVDDQRRVGALHVLRWDNVGLASGRKGTFGPEAALAWRTALAALNRSLPLLYEPLRSLETHPVWAYRASSFAPPGVPQGFSAVTGRVDGASFGLSFALAQASMLFGTEMKLDLAATAEVDELGRTRPVAGIEAKVAVLVHRAPRVCRLLVAPDDKSLAESAAGESGLKVIAVKNIAEALEEAFPVGWLDDLLRKRGDSQAARLELSEWFFQLALHGRDAAPHWSPIERAAAKVLEHWGEDLNLHSLQCVEFAKAVAARHQGKSPSSPWTPAEEWLKGLPHAVLKDVVAHMVQQSADMGIPPPDEARRLVKEFLEPLGLGRDERDLKIVGSLARLEAVSGPPALALSLAEEAATGWRDLRLLERSSYVLCTWYNMGRALGKAEVVNDALDFHKSVVKGVGFDRISGYYVDLAEAAACVAVGIELGSSLQLLKNLAQSQDRFGRRAPDMPRHVRWSALRRALQSSMAVDSVLDKCLVTIREHELKQSGSDGALFGHLIDLDRALADANEEEAVQALTAVAKCSRPVVEMLRKAARVAKESEASYVARLFPY